VGQSAQGSPDFSVTEPKIAAHNRNDKPGDPDSRSAVIAPLARMSATMGSISAASRNASWNTRPVDSLVTAPATAGSRCPPAVSPSVRNPSGQRWSRQGIPIWQTNIRRPAIWVAVHAFEQRGQRPGVPGHPREVSLDAAVLVVGMFDPDDLSLFAHDGLARDIDPPDVVNLEARPIAARQYSDPKSSKLSVSTRMTLSPISSGRSPVCRRWSRARAARR